MHLKPPTNPPKHKQNTKKTQKIYLYNLLNNNDLQIIFTLGPTTTVLLKPWPFTCKTAAVHLPLNVLLSYGIWIL